MVRTIVCSAVAIGQCGEKWLYSPGANKWYYILPNEQLWEWDDTPHVLSGTLVATLTPGTYANPQFLYDGSTSPAPVQATATIAANVLTITKNAGFFGTVVATVAVSDGRGGQDSETFDATFVAATRSARSSNGMVNYRSALDLLVSKEDLLDAWTWDELVSGLAGQDPVRKR